MKLTTRQLTLCAVLTAMALALSYLENFFPLSLAIPIPGIKLGLANIVTVFTVFAMGGAEGTAVLFCRIFLGAVFAGNFSTVIYSAAGGALAILTTIALKRILTKKQLWVAGCLGAVAHSVGQMAAAVVITATPSLLIYLPVLMAVSILTGCFTGLCAQTLLDRGDKLWKTIFR